MVEFGAWHVTVPNGTKIYEIAVNYTFIIQGQIIYALVQLRHLELRHYLSFYKNKAKLKVM